MIYLKLFEGFAEDYNDDLKALSDKYNSDKKNLLKRYKDEVDQFMFDLTDEYSHSKSSFIEEDRNLSLFFPLFQFYLYSINYNDLIILQFLHKLRKLKIFLFFHYKL